jgi:hypothetical protein
MEPTEPLPEATFEIDTPSEIEAGAYADFASVWHTPDTFVLDFVAITHSAVRLVDEVTGIERTVIPAKTTARVRLPPSQVFELARVLTTQLDRWERETGRRPPTDDIPGIDT